MKTIDPSAPAEPSRSIALESAIRIGMIALLAFWCYKIVEPFVVPISWGLIIAVAAYPLYSRLERVLSGRRKLAATLFTLLALALLITPTVMLGTSLADSAQKLATTLTDGSVKVPPPSQSVAQWPLIGERLYAFWSLASQNLQQALKTIAPQLEALGKWLLAAGASTGLGVLQFAISILIAGVLVANAEGGTAIARRIAIRFAGSRGGEFAIIAGKTVRSVAQGVLGVAAIQALLAGIGLLFMGVPGAGLWAVLVLLLAIVQLPPLLILGPIVVYVFYVSDTIPAVLFAIWSLFVSTSDTFLKPMLLGRRLQTPMLVILIGAIGGMLLSGVIGLFVGSVILALGFELFMAWLAQVDSAASIPGATVDRGEAER
jgi:predicted PurR-regulated permease PerM